MDWNCLKENEWISKDGKTTLKIISNDDKTLEYSIDGNIKSLLIFSIVNGNNNLRYEILKNNNSGSYVIEFTNEDQYELSVDFPGIKGVFRRKKENND